MNSYFDYIDIERSVPDNRMLILPHQQAAVDAMTAYFRPAEDLPDRSGLIVMPTGSGKTFTAVNWLLSQGVANGYRVVWLVHRQELVQQTYNEFVKQSPLLIGTGVKKLRILPVSGRHVNMSVASKADVYVCSIASVANRYGYRFIERMLGAQGKRRLIVVIDEAHHAVAANYRKALNRMTALNPNRILLGLTATPKRMLDSDQGMLQRIFHIDENLRRGIGVKGFIYEVTLNELIASRFLARPVYVPVETNLIGEVEFHCTPEDEAFFEKYFELSERLKSEIARSSARNELILRQYLNNRKKYGKTLIFAVNQMHAETLCDLFQKAGVRCDYAVSDRPDAQEVIERFKNNEFDVLINVMIMTEGSDVPDIRTVFLTRETNSESLLMQMIGRGLRGKKAKGTDVAYIVSFHDQWNAFAYWLDPRSLEIFDAFEETPDGEEALPAVETNEEMLALMEEQLLHGEPDPAPDEPQLPEITDRDVYMKLYGLMKANLTSEEKRAAAAVGWYSLIDENGEEVKMLVFDTQTACYRSIERNLPLLLGKATQEGLLQCYFADCETRPDENELQYFVDYINDIRQMPAFFALAEVSRFNIKAIREEMDSLFSKEEDKEAWLKELYNGHPILRQIYRYFFAFKKTVFDYTEETAEARIEETPAEREEYEFVENYFDLRQLLDEVLAQFPGLTARNLLGIDWSRNFVKKWFANCTLIPADGKMYFAISVNKLLSSPKVNREVIKYLIFHELLHENGYWNHDPDFRAREWQYPDSAALDGFLDELRIAYDVEQILKEAVWDESYLPPEGEASPGGAAAIPPEAAPPADEAEYDTSAPGVEPGFKYCRNCGNKLPADALFCDKCGRRTDY